ncbi:hypothetical protein [Rasiella sp. SM2506]|uniref:hypothetical protein n=1 Tax=Rasiella sp. SM2506 TaxID=3423914 RepID=UPI003D7C0833
MKLIILVITFLNVGILFGQKENEFLDYGCHKDAMMYQAWEAVQSSEYTTLFTAKDKGSENKAYYHSKIEEWNATDRNIITIGDYTFKIIEDSNDIKNPSDLKLIKKRYELDTYNINDGTLVRVVYHSKYDTYDKIAYVCFYRDKEFGSCNFFGIAGPLFLEY